MSKILIVDDSSFMRGILKELLNVYFSTAELFEADSKESALEEIKKNQPDLVMLDVVMKDNELEGLETLREIRKISAMMHVIMLTSVGQQAVIEECKKLDVKHYIQKPFDKYEVLEAVRNYLE